MVNLIIPTNYRHLELVGSRAAVNEALGLFEAPTIIGRTRTGLLSRTTRVYYPGEALPLEEMKFTSNSPECQSNFFMRRDNPARLISDLPINSVGFKFYRVFKEKDDALEIKEGFGRTNAYLSQLILTEKGSSHDLSLARGLCPDEDPVCYRIEGTVADYGIGLKTLLDIHTQLKAQFKGSCGEIRFSTNPQKFYLRESRVF